MKPETYSRYAAIFDTFSNERISPAVAEFTDLVAGYLAPGAAVADIGGGTAYFTRRLLEKVKGISLTFVEPSPEMMAIARTRLPADAVMLEKGVEEALAGMAPQNVFIFLRSLYSFYNDLESYRQLARRLSDKTLPHGLVAIFEMPGKYEIAAIKEYFFNNVALLDLGEDDFDTAWLKLEPILEEYNRSIDDGIFTIFDRDQMVALFGEAGFELAYHNNVTTYIFRKSAQATPARG